MTQPGHRDTEPGEEYDDAPAQASSVGPAASMSLSTTPLANLLDAGYEYYQAGHGSWPADPVNRIAVFAVAVMLRFGSAIAIDSLRRPTNDVRADLKEQTATWSDNVEALSSGLQPLGRATDDLSRSDPPIPVDGARDLVTATQSISGPGVTVTLTDRNNPGKGSGAVQDQDIAMVVNAPWVAGAKAIPVNGQRIGPDTFAHTAGTVILVNVTPVSPPYEVTTIGDSNVLSVTPVWGVTDDYLSAAQSVNGMTVSSRASQSLSTEVLAPSSSQYA